MSEGKRYCKICHMGDVGGDDLCNPCRCSGTIKYIHRECLMSWIECSKIKRCDICHYEYRFRDIYKPDTPQMLPLSILIKGICSMGWKVAIALTWCILQMIRWLGVFYFNGYLFMTSVGLYDFSSRPDLKGSMLLIAVGIPLAWLAQINRCLFNQIKERFGGATRRRRMVNPSTILESLNRELLQDEESTRTSRRVLAHELDDNLPPGSRAVTSEGTSETADTRRERARRQNDPMRDFQFKPIISGAVEMTLPVSFISVIYGVGRLVYIPGVPGAFGQFLSDMGLKGLYSRLVGFGIVFWMAMECAGHIWRRCRASRMKYVHVFMKIYLIIMMNIFFMNLTFGLVLHYVFGRILNRGMHVLDLNDEYGPILKAFMSLVFHMSIGYTFSIVIRNMFLRFKRCFRPGVFHFVPDDDDSRMDELYEASKVGVLRILFRAAMYLTFFTLFYGVGLTTIRLACGEVGVKFSIKSFLKLALSYKTFTMVLYSNKILCDYVVKGLDKVVRLEARLLGMENFLYNTRIRRYNKQMLRWCANRNKIFKRQHVKARERRRPTEREIHKYFNTQISSDFAIFYIPRLFVLRCGLIGLSVVLSLYCLYAGYAFIASCIVRRINMARYVRDSEDILFYLVLSSLFRLSWIMIHVVVSSVRGEKDTLQTVGDLCKHGIVNVYINTVYPLFGSLMVIMLSSDGIGVNGVRPLRLFLFFFSSTSIVETILSSSPEHYTFRALVRELCKINAFISVVFGIWYIYNAVTLLLGLDNMEFIILSVAAGYIIFVSKKIGQCIQSEKGFYKKLLDENYLIERRIVNIDEE
ncbi:vacuolar membrane proton pump [Encephalitozoon hellem]|uniref:RING-type E3 ubiquitin transferase n=1 Tax=Encephalitozoon hellem TaxID=27973 RepID=A0ABY8CIU9_ENCHE|nr:vacuolar membrane proton pump [Encephalitozoon hellem]